MPGSAVKGYTLACYMIAGAQGCPALLLLRDGSMMESERTLGMYLHSSHVSLFCGQDARIPAGGFVL